MKLRTMFAALIALACAPLASEKASAQNTAGKAVTSCGGESNTNGNAAPITIDLTGKECVNAGLASQYPAGATALTASATGTTAATAATLAGVSAKTTYICGFSISSDATAGLAGAATVAGTISGTLNYIQGVGVAPAVSSVNQAYSPCIPASATNTGIAVTSAAAGTGGNTAVTAWGYQL